MDRLNWRKLLGDSNFILKNQFFKKFLIRFRNSIGMDAWSAACTIYELYTGRILFPGNSNNQVGGYKLLDDTGLFESI